VTGENDGMSLYERPGTGRRTEVDAPSRWVRAGVVTVGFVAVLYVLEAVDQLTNNSLDPYGIQPRSEDGLVGIALAPLLHGSWGHLEGNTVPVLVLGFLTLVSGIGRGIAVTAVIWVVAGAGVWVFAPADGIHLGASSLIFGWLVYLIVRGVFTRSAGQIILGIFLVLAYGGILLGVLPGQPGISWQGHLFGAIGGGIAAMLLSDRVDRRGRADLYS